MADSCQQAEFNRYKAICKADDVNIPKKPALMNKVDDINKLVRRTWTEAELGEKLDRQQLLLQRFSGANRERLAKQIEAARLAGQDERVVKLQDELDSLAVPRLAFSTSLTPTTKKTEKTGMNQQERLAMINAENRRRNNESVRKAQLLEMQKTREVEIRDNRALASENATGSPSGTPDGVGASQSDSGTPGHKAALPPHIAKLQAQQRSTAKSGIPTIHKPLMDDDIIGALDLDIDIEID